MVLALSTSKINFHQFLLKDLGAKGNDLLSGSYDVDLIIGDMILSNSIQWKVANLKLNLGTSVPTAPSTVPPMYLPKHEIKVCVVHRWFQ